MNLAGFIDYCASLGLPGAELTGYYFPKFVQETPTHRPPADLMSEDPAVRQARVDGAVEYLVGLKNRAIRLGLEVSGTAIGNDFCVPEGPQWAAQINLCKDWIDRAAILGAPCIRIFAGRVPDGDSEENAIKRCALAIDECLKDAARRGVFLALENHGGVTATPEQMLKIVEAVQPSPWFGVNFDSGNFRSDDPYRDLAAIAPYAVNAQVKASVFVDDKKQPADLERIVGILKDADYRGYLALEYEETENPMAEIPKLVERLQSLVDA
jgi:sugar phosphate isomerase/epimerase